MLIPTPNGGYRLTRESEERAILRREWYEAAGLPVPETPLDNTPVLPGAGPGFFYYWPQRFDRGGRS